MQNNADYNKLSKARNLSTKMLAEIVKIDFGKPKPIWLDSLINRRLKVDYLIIELKYK